MIGDKFPNFVLHDFYIDGKNYILSNYILQIYH